MPLSLYSEEQLLLPRPRTFAAITTTELYLKASGVEGGRNIVRKMAPSEAIDMERKISHGIGGAGNIRRPSDVMFPVKEKGADAEDGSGRRRSSVWSKFTPSPGSSPNDRRNSILSMFKGNGAGGEKIESRREEIGRDENE